MSSCCSRPREKFSTAANTRPSSLLGEAGGPAQRSNRQRGAIPREHHALDRAGFLPSAFRSHAIRAAARSYSAASRSLTERPEFGATNRGRCFLMQLAAGFSCRVQLASPQFVYALSCRVSGMCRHSLRGVPGLFEENADRERRYCIHAGHQPDGRSQRPPADWSGRTRLHRHQRPLRLSRRTYLLQFYFHDPNRA